MLHSSLGCVVPARKIHNRVRKTVPQGEKCSFSSSFTSSSPCHGSFERIRCFVMCEGLIGLLFAEVQAFQRTYWQDRDDCGRPTHRSLANVSALRGRTAFSAFFLRLSCCFLRPLN